MPTGFTTIRAAVKAKLATVTELAFTYAYPARNIGGHPYAIMEVSNTSNDFLTNKENVRVIAFQVWIEQEINPDSDKSIEQATAILDGAADAVVAAFENDYSLGSVVDWCEAVEGPRTQLQTPVGLVLSQQLTIKTHFVSPLLT